jgi:hypothetical protein
MTIESRASACETIKNLMLGSISFQLDVILDLNWKVALSSFGAF